MNESNIIKAIAIAAGVFMAVATISLVMLYYNTAKTGLSSVGNGTNVYDNYDKYIRSILTRPNAYGTDVINLMNYFKDNSGAELSILKKDGTEFRSVNDILPNEKFRVVYDDSATIVKINATAID